MRLSSLRLPARASLWYTASAIIGRGCGFLFTPVLTRLLSQEAYGLYSLYTSWLGIFTIISTLELGGAVYMRAMLSSDDKDELLRSACALEFFLVGICAILYFAFYRYISALTELGKLISAVMFLQIFLNAIVNLYMSAAKFAYSYKTVFFINVISGCLPIPISIIFIKLFGVRLYAKITAQIAVSLVVVCFLLYNIFGKRRGVSPVAALSLLRRGIVHFPHYISTALISRVDKIFIASAYGKESLAKYSIADTVGSLLLFAVSAPMSALTPWVLRKISAKRIAPIASVCDVCLRIVLWFALLLCAFTPEIMRFLAPPEYSDALLAVYPIAGAAIPYFAFAVVSSALAHGGGAVASLPSVIGGAAALCLSFLFTRLPSFTYTALVIPICYTLMALTGSFIAAGRGIFGIIKQRRITYIMLFCAAVSLALFILRDNIQLRIAAAVLFCIPLVFDLGSAVTLVKE